MGAIEERKSWARERGGVGPEQEGAGLEREVQMKGVAGWGQSRKGGARWHS